MIGKDKLSTVPEYLILTESLKPFKDVSVTQTITHNIHETNLPAFLKRTNTCPAFVRRSSPTEG